MAKKRNTYNHRQPELDVPQADMNFLVLWMITWEFWVICAILLLGGYQFNLHVGLPSFFPQIAGIVALPIISIFMTIVLLGKEKEGMSGFDIIERRYLTVVHGQLFKKLALLAYLLGLVDFFVPVNASKYSGTFHNIFYLPGAFYIAMFSLICYVLAALLVLSNKSKHCMLSGIFGLFGLIAFWIVVINFTSDVQPKLSTGVDILSGIAAITPLIGIICSFMSSNTVKFRQAHPKLFN